MANGRQITLKDQQRQSLLTAEGGLPQTMSPEEQLARSKQRISKTRLAGESELDFMKRQRELLQEKIRAPGQRTAEHAASLQSELSNLEASISSAEKEQQDADFEQQERSLAIRKAQAEAGRRGRASTVRSGGGRANSPGATLLTSV